MDKPTINSHGAQAELQEQALNLDEERDGDTSGKHASGNGAGPPPNGHGDGAEVNDGAHVEGANGLDADANILGVNRLCTDSGHESDCAAYRADLNPNFEAAKRFLTTLDPTETEFTFQTFDDNKARRKENLKRLRYDPLARAFCLLDTHLIDLT